MNKFLFTDHYLTVGSDSSNDYVTSGSNDQTIVNQALDAMNATGKLGAVIFRRDKFHTTLPIEVPDNVVCPTC